MSIREIIQGYSLKKNLGRKSGDFSYLYLSALFLMLVRLRVVAGVTAFDCEIICCAIKRHQSPFHLCIQRFVQEYDM